MTKVSSSRESRKDELEVVRQIAERVLGPNVLKQLHFETIEMENQRHVFEVDQQNESVIIRGSSPVAMASGLNWYLKYVCHVSYAWGGYRFELPSGLPKVEKKIRNVRTCEYFYNLNYVTFSYTMAFWDWDRWEKELDWMALNGIDLVLELTGHEEVWRRTLRRIGYSDDEIKEYLCGPAFFPFQWLGCMYGWGGNLPDQWFEDRLQLVEKIHERMRELKMTRILQAYTGIVPPNLSTKIPESKPISQGVWAGGMERPSILSPEDPAFKKIAKIFYEEQNELFGTDHFYAGDPFHEGGKFDEVSPPQMVQAIQAEMLGADSEAVWVLQAWWENPTNEMLRSLNREHSLILDLWGEHSPRWKREGENIFEGIPFIWSFLHNFGGRLGLYGNIRTTIENLLEAYHHPETTNLKGFGLVGEGLEQNPIIYDLVTEMGWRSEIDIDEWVSNYISRRYGKSNQHAQKAWDLLKESAYGYSKQPGPTQSIINQRPTKEGEDKVFNWKSTILYYDKAMVEEACRQMYQAYHDLSEADGYLYDLVDVTRQALANKSQDLLNDVVNDYNMRNLEAFERSSAHFINLIKAQDRLLGTRSEFLLGLWLEQAKKRGHTQEEKELYEVNARTLITIWAADAERVLHEYGNKEWSGLTKDFYLPRWQLYIDSLRTALQTGNPPETIKWFECEYAWTFKKNTFPTEPTGDIHQIVGDVIEQFL